ncbi:MAG: PepSY-like domain-containing protein [Tannerellaceae bacterium]|nr:PepSY-like domain-containing protein [Tannerellaceae bacterium]
MKRFMMACICLFAIHCYALADDDKRIDYNQLPEQARQFIEQHFSSGDIEHVMEDSEWGGLDKSYEVHFTNGTHIEFDSSGEWEDIKCKYSHVPDEVVPQPILNYANQHHPSNKIVRLDKGFRKYEAKLDNGRELVFDLNFKFRKYDD